MTVSGQKPMALDNPATPAAAVATSTGPSTYNRQLQRVFYTSALISIQRNPASKAYSKGKRAEGKRHSQAVLARSPADESMSWGPCSETAAPTNNEASQRPQAAAWQTD